MVFIIFYSILYSLIYFVIISIFIYGMGKTENQHQALFMQFMQLINLENAGVSMYLLVFVHDLLCVFPAISSRNS